MRTLRIAVAAGLGWIASCTDPAGACDPCRTSAIVYGSLQDAHGAALVRVPLDIRAFAGSCDQGLRGGGSPYTDSIGNYRTRVSSLHSPHVVHCVRITVNPGMDARWPTATFDTLADLGFRFEENEHRLDSLRIDVTVEGEVIGGVPFSETPIYDPTGVRLEPRMTMDPPTTSTSGRARGCSGWVLRTLPSPRSWCHQGKSSTSPFPSTQQI